MTGQKNRFDLLPPVVLELLKEVMNGEPKEAWNPEDESPAGQQRANAYELCWGWEPPLLHPGNIREITLHGLAALAWQREQTECSDPPVLVYGIRQSTIDRAREVLKPLPCRVLDYLLKHGNRVELAELMQACWGEKDTLPKSAKALLQQANNLLCDKHVGIEFSVVNDRVHLQPTGI